MMEVNSSRKKFIIIAGILLVGYILILITITYFDQKEIKKFQNNEIKSQLKSKTVTLEYFFNSITNDFTELSREKVITIYFTNKDLGMSMKYGLKASLNKIDRLLKKFSNSKTINGLRIFNDISIINTNNQLLSSTNSKYIFNFNQAITDTLNSNIIIKKTNSNLETYLIKTLNYKGKRVGNIVASINLKEIFDKLISDTSHKVILSLNDDKITKDSSYLSMNIKGTPYSISTLKHNNDNLYSKWFVIALSLLSIPILGTIYYLIVLNNRNIKLEEEKNTEKILLQQSKVAAIGEMLGNISHQWRQPLSIISSHATGLKLALEFKNEVTEEKIINYMDNINNQAQYLSKTIDDFRSFFKGDSNTRKSFNIKDLFEKLESLTKDSLKNNYIKYDYKIISCTLEGNENILIQALINIFNNAKDALVSNLVENEDKYFVITTEINNGFLEIKIMDNAGGIKESIIPKVFNPYFTTKHESIGTGIGLYMTNQIITKQFRGNISVSNKNIHIENKDYIGAEFKIVIPLN